MKILFKRKMESGSMSLEGNIEKDVETERKVHEGYTSEDESNPSLDKYFSARSSAFVLESEWPIIVLNCNALTTAFPP
jgi:hypothetical protein